jgi:hypothetical protein
MQGNIKKLTLFLTVIGVVGCNSGTTSGNNNGNLNTTSSNDSSKAIISTTKGKS